MKPAILVPVYNHGNAFRELARKINRFDLPVIVVDDGSEPETRRILADISQTFPSFHMVRLKQNRGKGGAVKAGVKFAEQSGYTHVIQIDADEQHDPSDIPLFLDRMAEHPQSLVLGIPRFDDSIPDHRYYMRYFSHVWVWIETLSLDIPDALCGYRGYPVEQTTTLLQKYKFGDRMEFDPGVAVRFYWDEVDIRTVETEVTYHKNIKSNYNLLDDTVRISWMHCRSVFGMLYRFPHLLRRTQGKYSNL